MKRKRMTTVDPLGPSPFDPSGRDIRAACERIQSAWSENERRKRAGTNRLDPWLPPLIGSYQMGADFEIECDN